MRMESQLQKPHAVCIPCPGQGHIKPMMKLARILHFHGFHITFVNTDYSRRRFLCSHGPHSLAGFPSFVFASIPDGLGLPPTSTDADTTQHIPSLCASMERNSLRPLTDLLRSLNHAAEKGNGPRVTCIVSDAAMPFTVKAAEELEIKLVMFWPAGACALLGCAQYRRLVQEDVVPFKDANFLTNGCLEKPIEGIPVMKGMRLKDIPTFIRTTDPRDIMLNHFQYIVDQTKKATAIIFNTYYDLDCDVLASLAPDFPPLYPVGPLHFLEDQLHDKETESLVSSLWKADPNCLQWLDSQQPKSVVYVNFGSSTVMTNDQLVEFAWGLANSCKSFLWIIRPDLVTGESPALPHEFVEVIKGRSFLASWCDQERVLSHLAIGGFLTHSGWNSTLDSICNGVPMISWPFFGDQQTNCWFCCNKWGIAMEIDSDVKRDMVEKQVRELMDGESGKKIKMRVVEWKRLAEEAAANGSGKSWMNLKNLIDQVLLY